MGAAEACRAGRPAAGVPSPSIEAQRGPIRPDPYLRPAVDRPWTAPGRQLDCCRPSRSERTVTERPARVADAPAAARVAVLIDTAHRPGCRQRESSAVVRGNPRANCTRNGVRPCPGRYRPPRITGLTPPCVTFAPDSWRRHEDHALLPAGAGARSPRFGGHGDACAPGVLAKLRPVREGGGVVLELGCGSGALTRHLVAAGHRVIATDASPAMLALTREAVPGVEAVRRLPCPTTSSRPPTL